MEWCHKRWNYELWNYEVLFQLSSQSIILDSLSKCCHKILCWNNCHVTVKYRDTTLEKILKFSIERVSATVSYEYRRVNGIIFLKPAIHYSQTWRIGDKIIFSLNKILLAKTRRMCCCAPFVVRRQFLRSRQFFFRWKNTLCSSTRPLPRCKSCVQHSAKNLFTKHDERLSYTIRLTLFFRRFAPISLLFANSI